MRASTEAEAAPAGRPAAVRCRPLEAGDLDGVAAILCRGFADRDPAYWHRGFARLAADGPAGQPRYGFALEAGGRIVGVLLTLHARVGGVARCNLSSWYVEPEYRAFGVLLDRAATRDKSVTYINVTPAPPTWPMLEAGRYRRYCRGQMLAVPALSRPRAGLSARRLRAGEALDDLPAEERDLVAAHLGYGCLAFLCRDRDGSRPILLQRRTIGLVPNVKRFGQVPALQLVYARSLDDVAAFAGPIGRRLLMGGASPLLVMDAAGPVRGLAGRFFPGRAPKYQRGDAPVALGDLAYTELVLFGP